jgi:cell division septation protein DedD
MARDDDGAEPPREIRLEGVLLMAVSCGLLVLLGGAFQLGRMVERGLAPARASASSEAAAGVEPESAEANEKPTFFDTVSGAGKEAEPAREAQAKSTKIVPPAPAVTPGAWFVQVFVGRDRQAAEDVVRSLRTKSYPVRIDAVAEGASGSLFKVRVGGFPTKEAADAAADKLHGDGHGGTWVVRLAG